MNIRRRQTGISGSHVLLIILGIAVVGLAIMVGVPMYRDYSIQTEVREAASALVALREPIERQLTDDGGTVDADRLPPVTSEYLTSDLEVDFDEDGTGTAIVMIGGDAHDRVRDVALRLSRRPDGAWRCEVDPVRNPLWRDVYLPKGCRRYVR